MTVGTFGNKSDGKGVYFNLEAYRKMSTGNSIANPSLSAGDVKTLSKYVTEHSYWTCPENCSVWASRAWNLFADTKKQLSPGYPATPTKLKGSIGKLSGYEENIKLPKVKKSDVMYLGTDGKPTAADAKTINVSSTGSGLLDSLPFAVCF
ncbi:MAG: hypothetical protein FWG47_01915 [Propionibacteriaceae bacterium]|nr:hypothetical protein [Propionibacteriaceae bacterium]